ncbi:7-deoxyloganetic acid glucosyl transferase-like isoform X1 [Salvia splendens]|uniref:7-deoxyloganetic acid glucosyl transferase-like isoform X1 n=1 Tax=Salvia splendens TaxID=180675 RepID=UPI001C27ED1B|nr:7-deoxyloganetic acid glucosyl transferase-like isoform X1 [Salvia splendens]
MGSEGEKLPPHILIFPYPIQGHLSPMLNLAHLFCLSEFHVTFVVSDFSHRRLLQHTAVASTFAHHPGFQFRTISDGLPDDHPRAGERVLEVYPSVTNVMVPRFKKMMADEDFLASAARRPVTCFVADGLLSFAVDFAEESQIPLLYFRTSTLSNLWAFFHINELIAAKEVPVKGDMDALVKSVPGMEGFLRRRDLPSFFRGGGEANDSLLKSLAAVSRQLVRAQGAIFNTFEDIEGPIISQLHSHIPKIYTIGPIHEHLKCRLIEKEAEAEILSGNFWAEDRSCIDWLNSQPPRSVIYVSFGSITVVTREQLMEFWHGLVNSSQRFLWVMRPDSVAGKEGGDDVPEEVVEGTKEKGYMVKWAPQEEVLNHPAVGGFLTHSGWNSTLESIVAGVPMICWPYFGDQTINSRFVSDVWGMGLDIKDSCDRLFVEKAVREVMEVRKDEFLERAQDWSKLAKKAVRKGGSSSVNLDDLVDYISSLVI